MDWATSKVEKNIENNLRPPSLKTKLQNEAFQRVLDNSRKELPRNDK